MPFMWITKNLSLTSHQDAVYSVQVMDFPFRKNFTNAWIYGVTLYSYISLLSPVDGDCIVLSAECCISGCRHSGSGAVTKQSLTLEDRHVLGVIPWSLLYMCCCCGRKVYRLRTTVKMELGGSFETFVPVYQTERCHIAKNSSLNVKTSCIASRISSIWNFKLLFPCLWRRRCSRLFYLVPWAFWDRHTSCMDCMPFLKICARKIWFLCSF